MRSVWQIQGLIYYSFLFIVGIPNALPLQALWDTWIGVTSFRYDDDDDDGDDDDDDDDDDGDDDDDTRTLSPDAHFLFRHADKTECIAIRLHLSSHTTHAVYHHRHHYLFLFYFLFLALLFTLNAVLCVIRSVC